MANNKNFKVKNGILAPRFLDNIATSSAGGTGPFDSFSIDLWDGTDAEQTITNGLDLSTDGGMVWTKSRESTQSPFIYDTVRGANQDLGPTEQRGSENSANTLTSFNSNGYTIGSSLKINYSLNNYVGWSFKKEPGFFDVIQYSGDGSSSRNISHSLGVTPGMIWIKRTDTNGDWIVYHVGADDTNPANYYLQLNDPAGRLELGSNFNNTVPTSSVFTVGGSSNVNHSSGTYMAYLFANDTGANSRIKIGKFTEVSGSDVEISLGFRPQFLLIKTAEASGNWGIYDTTRGWTAASSQALLANAVDVESTVTNRFEFSDTSFTWVDTGNSRPLTYMVIAESETQHTLDLSTGNKFSFTPSQATTMVFSNPPATGSAIGFELEVNDSTGYTLTWPSSIKWPGGTTPSVTTGKSIYTFVTADGGTTYFGKKAGENVS